MSGFNQLCPALYWVVLLSRSLTTVQIQNTKPAAEIHSASAINDR